MPIKAYSGIRLSLALVLLLLIVYPNIGWSQNQVMLPLLQGQKWEQASRQLAALGLLAKRVAPAAPCDDLLRLNLVLSQYPEPGAWLAPGSQVTLVTCAPVVVSYLRQVPELSGLTLAQAKPMLQKLNLKLRYSFSRNCMDPFLQNKIIKQQPVGLSQVRRGTVVWVSICQEAP